MVYSLNNLEDMKAKALKEICVEYAITSSGNKKNLIERIIAHQDTQEKKRQEWDALMAYGAAKRDDYFERVIQVFEFWCNEEGFHLSKSDDTGVLSKWVHMNEIRAAFSDYNPDTSPLREDMMVPAPSNKLEVFLEMLFNERQDWEIIDSTEEDREFSQDSEYSDKWMIEGLNKIYAETV